MTTTRTSSTKRRVPGHARLTFSAREALRFLGRAHRQRRRTAPPGARPGTLVIPTDARPPRLRWLRYTRDRLEDQEVAAPEALGAALEGGTVDWIDVCGFGDEALLRRLGEVFAIHPLAMADVVNVPQRPKVEAYGDRVLVILRAARFVGGEVELQQVSFVLGPGGVLSFCEHPSDLFEPVRQRLRAEHGRLRELGADYLAYALIDAVVDGFFPVLDGIADVLEDLEQAAIAFPEPQTLARIHATRRLLVLLERVQRQQRDALLALARNEDGGFSPEVRPYLRDVQDHAIHQLDTLETYREMTVGLMDIYLSCVGNRTNEVMKTLTVMASLFIPLSFIAGVYGMNFDYMPELHWRWGYPAVWGVMLLCAGGLLGWFRRRGWLGEGMGVAVGDAPSSPSQGMGSPLR